MATTETTEKPPAFDIEAIRERNAAHRAMFMPWRGIRLGYTHGVLADCLDASTADVSNLLLEVARLTAANDELTAALLVADREGD